MENIVARLEAVALKLESFEGNLTTITQPIKSSHAPTNGTTTDPPPSTAFSSNVLSLLPPLSTLTNNTSSADPSVHSAISLFSKAFYQQLDIIKAMESHPHPTSDTNNNNNNLLPQLLAPLASTLTDLSSMTSSSSSRSPCINHLKFIAEASQCLTWIAYTGPASSSSCGMSLPPQHIDEAWSAAEFWCNKVLLEYKSQDSGVQPWVGAIKEIVVVALKGFVAQYYPTGLVLGTHGNKNSGKSGSTTSRAPPPPPPPPPPPGSLAAPKIPKNITTNNSTNSVGALLAEINAKGSGITAGLKKVTSDMKTKNIPKDGTGGGGGGGGGGGCGINNNKPSSSNSNTTTIAAEAACVGRMECEQGRKWVVENHTNNKDLQITETQPKQAVYIYNCTNCTIQVSGKVNSIAVDKCTNTALLFDTTVASCEVVNSSKVQIQWRGMCPTVAVDKTDGCQLYIPRRTVERCEVNTAKSSEVNVVILPDDDSSNGGGGGEDAQESAIPEQFVSRYMGGKWTTEPVNHGSG